MKQIIQESQSGIRLPYAVLLLLKVSNNHADLYSYGVTSIFIPNPMGFSKCEFQMTFIG